MSLPAYLFLYNENGVLIKGDCLLAGREGAIEIMSSSYAVSLGVDAHSGSITGTRMHKPFIIHKYIDKISPYLAIAVCESRRLQKAEMRYYDTNDSGLEYEIYRVVLDDVVVMSVEASHSYIAGSRHPNMLETVALRFRGITWHYKEGNIQYSDSWMKKTE
ncbi:type VI secretion system tube protein Hcp (plasmid) [Erwinia sp. E602]|uniref:Hcp family type VI secretion system effector n=1 Tax=Erwinia sp. E602 TaxID=2675378 RepID=UPI001BA97A92|nr:type VI secretion system tube protein TssD [Erwinia sp. E602]QUG73685.1 type VI secretion system tube protein Hcp [Erwinia sp. E602]